MPCFIDLNTATLCTMPTTAAPATASRIPQNKWQEEDRPEYKLATAGRTALSDAELVSLTIGPATDNFEPVEVARQLLSMADNSLHNLAKMGKPEMCKVSGMTAKKCTALQAAFELGRRRGTEEKKERPRIGSARDVYSIFQPLLGDLPHEEFWILVLNKANEVTHTVRMSVGGQSGTVVDIKLVFAEILAKKGAAFIAAHNHPTGNLQPSSADNVLTTKMRKAGEMMDLPCLDHLIITEHGYYSFADEGAM